MVLLLEQLDATTLQVGLVTSAIFVLYPVLVLATATLARLGFRRQMVTAWVLRAFFLVVPLGIAIHAPEEPAAWMADAVVAAVFGFCFFRAFGVACHIPWLASILPDPVRGRFFATEHAVTSAVGVVALLGCAALFALLPAYTAFRVVYSVALFGSAMAVASLLRLPDGPRPDPSPLREMLPETRRLCLEPGLFRQYLFLTVLSSVVGSSFVAFAIYYLKTEQGLPSSRILTFTAAQFGGSILATWIMRRSLDRVAIRRFLQIGSFVFALLFAYWLGIVSGESDWLAAVLPSFFVVGLALGVNGAAHTTFLPELAAPARRPIAVAVFGAVAGVLQGVGPILWGAVLRTGGGAPGVDETRFALFFGLGIVLCGLHIFLLRGLPETRSGIPAAA